MPGQTSRLALKLLGQPEQVYRADTLVDAPTWYSGLPVYGLLVL